MFPCLASCSLLYLFGCFAPVIIQTTFIFSQSLIYHPRRRRETWWMLDIAHVNDLPRSMQREGDLSYVVAFWWYGSGGCCFDPELWIAWSYSYCQWFRHSLLHLRSVLSILNTVDDTDVTLVENSIKLNTPSHAGLKQMSHLPLGSMRVSAPFLHLDTDHSLDRHGWECCRNVVAYDGNHPSFSHAFSWFCLILSSQISTSVLDIAADISNAENKWFITVGNLLTMSMSQTN